MWWTDLARLLSRLVPEDTRLYRHTAEGPDEYDLTHSLGAHANTGLRDSDPQRKAGPGHMARGVLVRAPGACTPAQCRPALAGGVGVRQAARFIVTGASSHRISVRLRHLYADQLLVGQLPGRPVDRARWVRCWWCRGSRRHRQHDRVLVLFTQCICGARMETGRLSGRSGVRREGSAGQPAVAEQMRDFMVSRGKVPAAAVRVETESHSTHENALKSKPILNDSRKKGALLTSDYHMFRAYRAFRKVGMIFQPRPFPMQSSRACRGRIAGRYSWAYASRPARSRITFCVAGSEPLLPSESASHRACA